MAVLSQKKLAFTMGNTALNHCKNQQGLPAGQNKRTKKQVKAVQQKWEKKAPGCSNQAGRGGWCPFADEEAQELFEAQAGIQIAGRNINNLRYTDDTTFMAESEKELKSLQMKVKEES